MDDFFTDYEIQRNKLLKSMPIDSAEKQNIDQGMMQIRVSAHHQGKGEYWWAGKNFFKDLAEEMRVQQVNGAYERWVALNHAMYKRACISLHASRAGNMLRLGDAPDFTGVDNRQRKDGHESSLLLAVCSFLYVVGVVCVEFGIDGADWNVRLNDLLIYYNTFLKEK